MDVSGAEGVMEGSSEDAMETNHQSDARLAAGVKFDRFHIYILCDTTGSMGDYVSSLAATIIQLEAMIRLLLPERARIAVVSYKDYQEDEVCTYVPLGSTPEEIVTFVRKLRACGGGDRPYSVAEATKTGLNKIAEMVEANADSRTKSLVIHYTDAPPHCTRGDKYSRDIKYPNEIAETEALKGKDPGYDWVRICRYFAYRGIPIYTFLAENPMPHDRSYRIKRLMIHLGPVVLMHDKSSYNVTKATIGMIHHVLGEEFEHDEDFKMLGYKIQGKYVPYLDLTLSSNSHIKNETRQGGLVPDNFWGYNYSEWSEKVAFHFRPIGIKLDVKKILDQFSTDSAYQNMVFEVFDELFTSECCLSMTYNPILGKMWRKVCKRRGDDRLQTLQRKLSDAINGVKDPVKRKQIKDWLDASYNAEDEIADIMLDVKSYKEGEKKDVPCLVIDPATNFGADLAALAETLRSLARAPTQEALALAQKIMTSLLLIKDPSFELPVSPTNRNGVAAPRYLPLSLLPKFLFGCLPHLVSPGMMFSLRPAIMVAIIAFLSGNEHLVETAKTFLEANMGKWINLDDVAKIPEVLSVETVKLLKLVPQFLTNKENGVYAKLFQVCRLRLAFRKEFQVTLPLIPDVKNVLPDHRFQCVSCEHYRSFTLMTSGSICGLCVYIAENPDCIEYVENNRKNGNFYFSQTASELGSGHDTLEADNDVPKSDVPKSDVPDPTSQSRLAYCRTCSCIYEVIKHQDLKVKPKCHYCRTGQKAPYVACDNCSNRYVLPDPSLLEKMGQNEKGKWICATCVNKPRLSFEQVTFSLKDILRSNLHLMREIFNLVEATFKVIDGKSSLFKIFTENWDVMEETPLEEEKATPVMLRGQRAFKVEGLKEEIKKAVEKEDLKDMCLLCFEDKPIQQLATSPCGRCNKKICYDCQRHWVNQIQPGKVVLPSNLVCLFCKRVPMESVYTKCNPSVKSLFHKEHLKHVIQRMEPSVYYGWCKGCAKIQEICPVDCGGATVPYSTSDNFVCETCQLAMQRAPDVPKCPGCDAPSVKEYGCNHIECPVCKTHWCYVCGEEFEESDIYDHLIEVHGSIGLQQ